MRNLRFWTLCQIDPHQPILNTRVASRAARREFHIALKHGCLGTSIMASCSSFAYNGGNKAYVGVMAREVQNGMPSAMVRGRDGCLRVFYDKIGIKIETCDQWVASGEHVLTSARQRDHKVFCGSNQNRKRFSDTAGQTKHRLAKPRDIII